MATREKFRRRRVVERMVMEFCRKCVKVMPHRDADTYLFCTKCHTPRDKRGGQ